MLLRQRRSGEAARALGAAPRIDVAPGEQEIVADEAAERQAMRRGGTALTGRSRGYPRTCRI